MIPFNSRDYHYKSKFGAVSAGETVKLRLFLARDVCCEKASLVVRVEGTDEWMFLDMQREGDTEWWFIDFTPQYPGVYWYHFEFENSWGHRSITNVGSGIGSADGRGRHWQLTVFSPDFKTPDWFKGGIMYQIFPDRFARSGKEKTNVPSDRTLVEDIHQKPRWDMSGIHFPPNSDYFCGDLKGIEENLDYLKSLGVTCIYLNPIFEAHSSHRYDTADYMSIDPLLGDEEDFKSLCKSAKALGMHVILDGVFSHTGADSKYFNMSGRYDVVGAYNSTESDFYPWFNFNNWPNDYKCWWGMKNLPEVDETNYDFISFITGKDGVLQKWQNLGADGWRLDVADELPDVFLDWLRIRVKKENPDALVIGEVWEDASNKQSYGKMRRYLLGEQLDSVMNYPFYNAIVGFAKTGNSEKFMEQILSLLENYPKDSIDTLMNHMGTHDTTRIITMLAGEYGEDKSRDWKAIKSMTAEEYAHGVQLLKMASVLQYTLPGVPCIYYGDEIGMQGYNDPFNRAFFDRDNINYEILDWYKKLGEIRTQLDVFKDGEFIPISSMLGCVAFARRNESGDVMVISNRNRHEITYYLQPEWQHFSKALIGGTINGTSVDIPAFSTCIIV